MHLGAFRYTEITVMRLVKHKVENRPLSTVAVITNQSKGQVKIPVSYARLN